MPRRMAWLVVSTRFAVGSVHSVLLRCLVLGLGAKVPVPRILPRLVLELPQGVWGFPAACMALPSRCKVGARVSAKPPCHSAELHAQGAVSPQGCSQVWDASAQGPGAVPASLWWQQVSPGVTALCRVGRRNISSQKLFSYRVPMSPQSPISWGAQGEVTSGSHTRWDADLGVQCRFWLLHVGVFLFVTLKKCQSRATS